jgi:hypothetical protein
VTRGGSTEGSDSAAGVEPDVDVDVADILWLLHLQGLELSEAEARELVLPFRLLRAQVNVLMTSTTGVGQ